MKPDNAIFTIPTYRLRDVAETVELYDEHFWSNGHAVKIMVFDDSSLANHQKYYPLLEQTKTSNELYYVGPHEKEQFLAFLQKRLRDKNLSSLVRGLFRPSYGGNRNFTLMYTLGAFMVSADDDISRVGPRLKQGLEYLIPVVRGGRLDLHLIGQTLLVEAQGFPPKVIRAEASSIPGGCFSRYFRMNSANPRAK